MVDERGSNKKMGRGNMPEIKDESPVGLQRIFGVPDKSEVRTTSATGGQKGVKLERFDLIPIGPLTHLARHYGRGALKYDNHQWRQGYEFSKSYAALLRHLTAWWNGEEFDVCPLDQAGCKDPRTSDTTCFNHTGGHHLDGVMWHSFTLREFVETYPEHDDRYKPKPVAKNANEIYEEKCKELRKYLSADRGGL